MWEWIVARKHEIEIVGACWFAVQMAAGMPTPDGLGCTTSSWWYRWLFNIARLDHQPAAPPVNDVSASGVDSGAVRDSTASGTESGKSRSRHRARRIERCGHRSANGSYPPRRSAERHGIFGEQHRKKQSRNDADARNVGPIPSGFYTMWG